MTEMAFLAALGWCGWCGERVSTTHNCNLRRWCQYCTHPAQVFDIDGCWCSPGCRDLDRQSEVTQWRKAVAPIAEEAPRWSC